MIRLCFLCSSNSIGGLEKLVYDLCKELDRDRFETTVCLLRDGGNFIDLMVRDFPSRVHVYPVASPFQWGQARSLLKFLRNNRFDLIHAFGLIGDLFSRLLHSLGNRPALAGCVANPDLPNTFAKRLANRFSAGAVDWFWADCVYRAKLSMEKFRIPDEKTHVIYPGIDHDLIAKQCRDSMLVRQEIGIQPDSPIIGAVGDLRYIKGHDVFVKAAREVVQHFPKAMFVLVGADLTNGNLEKMIQKTGLSDHFRLLGFKEDAVSYLKAMDLVLQPSISEGLPRAVLEAMALGKTVIASEVGGIPEVIVDKLNGFLIPPANAKRLSEITIQTLGDPVLRQNIAEKARETVQRSFNLRGMIQKFENRYIDSLSRFENDPEATKII